MAMKTVLIKFAGKKNRYDKKRKIQEYSCLV